MCSIRRIVHPGLTPGANAAAAGTAAAFGGASDAGGGAFCDALDKCFYIGAGIWERLADLAAEGDEAEEHDICQTHTVAADEFAPRKQAVEPLQLVSSDCLESIRSFWETAHAVLEHRQAFCETESVRERLADS